MSSLAIAGSVTLLLLGAFIILSETIGLLRRDGFPNAAAKWLAYLWFGMFLFGLAMLVAEASRNPGRKIDLAGISFWSLFTLHLALLVFLAGWWALSGMPPLRRFFNLQRGNLFRATMIGFAVGVGGWAVTLTLAIVIGLLLMGLGWTPDNLEPSPMIPWMAALPVWKKTLIVASAMTVEELFFRGWLQKRVGLIASTILFAVAHAGYGQPIMLIGITIVSIIIGYTFYRTRDLLPCIIAHGVFDAIQLFVVVPLAMRFTGLG